MQTGLTTLLIVSPQLASVSSLVILLFREKAKKQTIVAHSSAEVEYRAMTSTTAEIVRLRWLLADLGISLSALTPMYCDNTSTIQITHNSVFYERTKHIEIDCQFTRHHL